MGNQRLYKIEHFHTLGTSESERLKVTALNLFHPTASPRLPKDRFLYVATQPHRAGLAGHFPVKGVALGILHSEDRHRSHLRVEHYLQGHFSLFTGD